MITADVSRAFANAVIARAIKIAAQRQTARPPAFEFRGAALEIQSLDVPEFIISGPSETGKTLAALARCDSLCRRYPGAQGAIVRKVRADMDSTVIKKFNEFFVKGRDVRPFGGESPSFYEYDNDSRLWIGGMDRPGKVLSGDLDFVYENQAEELKLEDHETLSTRTTGRAGHMPFGQVFGDCNPGGPSHWILRRPRLKVLQSKHEDNPTLFTADGKITERGKATMETLDALTGVRYQRLRLGLWMQAEGIVYSEFDSNNITDDEPDPALPIELAVDEGYIDPRVILFIQRTPDRILIFDEIYHSKHLAQTCVGETVAKAGELYGWKDDEKTIPKRLPEIAVGSPEAKELQTRLRMADISFRWPQDKSIVNGIGIVRGLICDNNKHRTIQVNRRCKNFLDEITEGYQYPAGGSRKNDELPVDANNHAMDAIRYWCQVRARR